MGIYNKIRNKLKKHFNKEELLKISQLEEALKNQHTKNVCLKNKLEEETEKLKRIETNLLEITQKIEQQTKKLNEKSREISILEKKLNNVTDINVRVNNDLEIWKKGPFPPGHFYSPTFLTKDIIFEKLTDFLNPNFELLGININDDKQKRLLYILKDYYESINFPFSQQENFLYWYDNVFFGYSDSIILSSIIQHFKPQKIIEVGSGFSSAVMMDVNDKVMNKNINLTFIEPYPEERLSKIITHNTGYQLIKDIAQNIPIDTFKQLKSNDILFIDSSHVVKYGSDVLYLLFNVLPQLEKGVIIHFHDIFYPFEYPYAWLKQGRFWNEAYFLRAFLMYNKHFEIIFHSSYLEKKYENWYKEHMPKCLIESYSLSIDGIEVPVGTQGQSIYLKKVR